MKNVIVMTMCVAMIALASSAQAAAVGYWRFEGNDTGYLQDSSTYDNDLTANGDVARCSLPSNFDNPIPQTGATNTQAASLDGAGDYYSCADQTEFAVTDFTIEAYINVDSAAGTGYIASQYLTTGDQRSWGMYYDLGSGTLRAGFSEDGTFANFSGAWSGIAITRGTDYFVAMSLDLSDKTSGVKFYVKNLSTDTWATATKSHTLDSLHNSTANLNIGSYNNGTGAPFNGVVDEVRFSNTILGQNDLLASVPEPATMTLLLLGLPLALRRRRK